MPKCFSVFGYIVFFWSNENDPLEPIHVHVAKSISANATKIWLLSDGSTKIAHNNSKISPKELSRISEVIEEYHDDVVSQWELYFGVKAIYYDE